MPRKMLFVLSIFAVVCLLSSACVPRQQPTAAKNEPTQAVTTPATGEQVTLTVWDFGGIEFEWLVSTVIPAFEAKHPNIKIEHLGTPESDYSTKLETAIAGNVAPDIALQSYQYRLWEAGHVLPLNDFMARDGFHVDDFYPIFKSWCMLEDKVYCMPVNVYVWAMLINKDLFKAAGLPELDTDSVITFDEWLEYARAINKPSDNLEDRVFGSVHFVPNWNSMNNYMSDPYVLGPDGRRCVGNADSADWIHAWDMMLTAYKENLTPATAGAMLGDIGGHDLFKQGKLGMIHGSYGHALEAQKAGVNVGLVGQPVVTKGWKGNVGSWATSYAIMASSPHPEEAWLFLKFLTTEGAIMLSHIVLGETGSNPPCYMPLAKDWAGADLLRQDKMELLPRVVAPPFSPDIWTAVDPFYEAWRRMTEDNVPVEEAVTQAAIECQEVLDEQWAEWEKLDR